jgi:NADH:ubiquinone oxidoreductase subunit F (NADH-binding)
MSASSVASKAADVGGLLSAWQLTGDASLPSHRRVHGELIRSSDGWPTVDRLVGLAEAAGLCGRGGAGFPTAKKLATFARQHQPAIVVVNAMESEPASRKEEALLSCAPHLVLDGAELVAAALGSPEIVVCIADDRRRLASRFELYAAERPAVWSPASVRVSYPPARYVSGEESSLVQWLSGGPAVPLFRFDKSTPLTIRRSPVLVQNAETLANLALIARYGPQWYTAGGATSLVTLWSADRSPVVLEVPVGSPIRSIITDAGVSTEVSAALVGGYGGRWIPRSAFDQSWTPGVAGDGAVSAGAGVLAFVSPQTCGLAETARIVGYMAGQSAGQCGPCTFGLPALALDLAQLVEGRRDRDLLPRIWRRLNEVVGRGACRHPDGVARLVASALDVFADDVAHHLAGHPCEGVTRASMFPLRHSADQPSGVR